MDVVEGSEWFESISAVKGDVGVGWREEAGNDVEVELGQLV